MSNSRLILEIGCGEEKSYNESIGLDIRRTVRVDIISDARRLPFKDCCFDLVFSSHILEHFSHKESMKVLAEWIRVIKIGGEIELRCPDLRIRALIFALKPSWKDIKNIYGEQDYPYNYHKSGYSYRLLKRALKQLGIIKIKRIIKGYKGLPFLPDCLHIKGVKSASCNSYKKKNIDSKEDL